MTDSLGKLVTLVALDDEGLPQPLLVDASGQLKISTVAATGGVSSVVDLLGKLVSPVALDSSNAPQPFLVDEDGALLVTLSAGDPSVSKVAVIADQKAQNTAGGTFSSGSWQTRDINTELSDADDIVSIANDQFTPIEGVYLVTWYAAAHKVDKHQSRLYNATQASVEALGLVNRASNADNVSNVSMGSFVLSADGNDAFEIQHRCETTVTDDGYGQPTNFGVEQYTFVTLVKIS